MATKKTTAKQIADATKPVIGMSPRRAPKAVLKTDAKRPSTKAAKERTDPVAVAGKALVKAATKPMRATAKKATSTSDASVPTHEVYSVADLRKVLGDFPVGSTFHALGQQTLTIYNVRGRLIAEVRKVEKEAMKKAARVARADKL
jgi:hypothetical protein